MANFIHSFFDKPFMMNIGIPLAAAQLGAVR